MNREVSVGRCHQSVMRERLAVEDRFGLFGAWWEDIDMSLATAAVSEADREDVADLIERYEWLGNLPDNCSLYAKLTFEGNTAGAVAFSRSGFGGSFTLLGRPAWKLARGVSLHWSPPWASSFLIRRSLALLFREPTYVVAFSDWEAGEVGTVYQAAGWTYLGHGQSVEWRSPQGERRDASFHKVRVVSGSCHRRTRAVASRVQYEDERDRMLADGWQLVRSIRGKYAVAVGPQGRARRRLQAELDRRARPYPRRAGSVNGEHAPQSSGEGEVRSLVRAPHWSAA